LLFIINSKNYIEASGDNALSLAGTIRDLRKEFDSVKVVLATQAFSLSRITSNFPEVDAFCQHVDSKGLGSTTGYLIPEIAKSFGARGSLINHSEHRVPAEIISELVPKLRQLSMVSVVCARDGGEVTEFAKYEPDYIAIEPPELIGSGKAVSKTRPDLIVDSRRNLDSAISRLNSKTKLLCGAGIVDPIDATRAVELGSDGILVASGVIKSPDWKKAILGLVMGLIAGEQRK